MSPISDSGDFLSFTTPFALSVYNLITVIMIGPTGHGMLSRARSQKKLHIIHPMDMIESQKPVHRRQHSDSAPVSRSSSTRSQYKGHWPPIEWDPLKLNPPVAQAPEAPARLHERQPLQCLQTKRSFAGHENRRPRRLHRSDSGFALDGYQDFDFAFDRTEAIDITKRREHHDVHEKGWPSPANSVDSDKSWFETSDDEDDDAVQRSNELWGDSPTSPQRRPQVASPDDPNYFIKRGAWKRRGIFFGAQTAEVHEKEDEAFDI